MTRDNKLGDFGCPQNLNNLWRYFTCRYYWPLIVKFISGTVVILHFLFFDFYHFNFFHFNYGSNKTNRNQQTNTNIFGAIYENYIV